MGAEIFKCPSCQPVDWIEQQCNILLCAQMGHQTCDALYTVCFEIVALLHVQELFHLLTYMRIHASTAGYRHMLCLHICLNVLLMSMHICCVGCWGHI